jgi:uncharacterized protein YjdB
MLHSSAIHRLSARTITAGALLLTSLAACAPADTTGPGDKSAPGTATQILASVSSVDLFSIGASSQVTLQVKDAKGAYITGPSVTWSSGDITVADVSGSGGIAVITARAPGRTTIRAASGPIYLDIPVTVSAARAITLNPSTVLVRTGDSYTFVPTIDADGTARPEVRWTTDNPAIASISASGTVTGVSVGTTAIRVSVVGDARLSAVATVNVAGLRSVKLSPSTLSVPAFETALLQATVDVNAGESQALTWTTDNPSVATVASNGQVTGVSVGSTKVRAVSVADPRARDSATIQVTAVRAIVVSPATASMATGETKVFTATVNNPPNGNSAVTWRSSNPSVAMVASNGMVTGVSQGTATITALATADTTRQGSAVVSIVPVVRDIDVQPTALSVFPGETRALTASVTADAGLSNQVTWKSSNPAVATVSASGGVTGVTAGTALITATAVSDSTRTATSLITVRTSPSVTVSPAAFTLALNETKTFAATVSVPAGLSNAVTWTSADPSIATVNSSGVVTGVGFGATSITATSVADPNAKATAAITVAPQITAISVSPATATVAPGATVQLTPSVTAQGGLSTAVTFRSSNPSVASVNFAGVVSAIANGSATVTVISQADTTKRATAAITVSSGPQRMASSWSTARLGGALYEDVVSLDAIDNSTAFAVNSIGDVFRYNGTSWQLAAQGSAYGTQFLSVSGVSASSAVAVGTNGTMIRFDGTSWSSVNTGTTNTLNSVWLENATSGFAVGANGTALRLSGGTWSATTTGSTQTLNAVWSSGGVAYAVGTSGEILRYSSSWSRYTPITSETLYGISGSSSTDVTAVGTFGTILRFTGLNWTKATVSETSDFYGIATNANTGVSYIASDVGLLQYSGTTLSTVATPYAPRLFAAALDGSSVLWTSGQRGSVMRQSGAWETLNLAPDLIDVWTASSNSAWAVGEFGTTYRWTGSSWSRVSTPTTATLNAVWSPSASDAFAGGDNGTMLRWNGSSWSTMTFPSSASVYGLWGSSSSNVFAVTSAGEVVKWNGSIWQVVASAGNSLWAIHGSSANDIMATGENGAALRYAGSTWIPATAPTTGTLAGIYAGGGFYLTVGANSTGSAGLAYSSASGTSWNSVNTGSTRILTSIWGPSSSDLYATGEQGTILRYTGSSWSTMTTGTTDLFWSVSGASDASAGFAVGYNSTLATATSGTSLQAVRAGLSAGVVSLNPRSGAKLVRGALPAGAAREHRKR